MGDLTDTLMQRPVFAFIGLVIGFIQLARTGVDIRPLVSEMVDEIIPAIA